MTKVVVDDALRTKLQGLADPLELCDESGRVLGRYLPSVRVYREPVDLCDSSGRVLGRFLPVVHDPRDFDGLEPQIGAEELQRRKANKGKTYTTAEVLAHLEAL